MTTTFYGVLGVEPDADADAIRRGYRARARRVHPDVNDDPDADAQFRRLATAKETLLDEDERERYDRLGHASYVRHHVSGSAWAVEDVDGTPSSGRAERAPAAESADVAGSADARGHGDAGSVRGGSTAATSGKGESWWRDREPSSRARGRSDRGGSVGESYGTSSFWDSQRVGERHSAATQRPHPILLRFVNGVRGLGLWVVVHLVFLTIASGTAWYTYAVVVPESAPPVAKFVPLAAVLLAALLSTLHVLSRTYR